MSFARLLPLVTISALACRLPNPAFEDGDGDGDSDELAADDSSGGESGTSLGESSTADDPGDTVSESTSQTSSSESESSSEEGVDTSSEGVMTSSSEEGVMDTSSEGVMDTSSEGVMDTSSEDLMESSSDGLDAPDLLCSQVMPADDCMTCMQNNCCQEGDMGCFDGFDEKCNCVLLCLVEGVNCDFCGADPNQTGHAQMLYECGVDLCANLCN